MSMLNGEARSERLPASCKLRTPVNLLAVARSIGNTLVGRAFYNGDRCTWLGRDPSEQLDPAAPIVPTVRTLSGDFYGGTAGVAVFLAQLERCVGPDACFRRTARAALSASLAAVREGRLGGPGLYDGSGGAGSAAITVGELLDDGDLISEGIELLEQAARRVCVADSGLDVVSGMAGVVLATAHHAQRHRRLLPTLIRVGEALLDRAIGRGDVWQWPVTPGVGGAVHCLTGFSHGASGIAAALLALYRETGRAGALAGALGTLRYEDGWFVPEHRNWPDLRAFRGSALPSRARDRRELTCARTWCHGAPGVLLTRCLAELVVPSGPRARGPLTRNTLAPALHTTLAATSDWSHGADVTPCHGATGLADCLLYAAAVVDPPASKRCRVAARTLVRRVVTAHLDSTWWTSGVPSGGPNPSLLVGMAGVGYGILRVHDPAHVPSILMPYRPGSA